MQMSKVLLANSEGQFSKTAVLLIVFCIGMTNAENAAVKIISPVKYQIFRFRNQSILFNCTFAQANGSTFRWYRNDEVINPSGKIDTPYWSSFVLKGLRVQDEAEYRCSYHQSGVKLDAVVVRLAAKPTAFTRNSSPLYSNAYDVIRLQCIAKGWPVPNITWITNGTNVLDINQHHRFLVTSDKPGHSMLTILSAFKEEEGIYICMAKNALGEDKVPTELIVRDAPVRPQTTMRAEKSKYTAVVGTDAKLVCIGREVRNDHFTFVFWKFNGTMLFNSSEYIITNDFFSLADGSTPKVRTQLSVLNVTFADSGYYSCIVESDYVTHEDTITLEVKAKDKYKDMDKENGMKTWLIALICVVAVILSVLLVVIIIVVSRRNRKGKEFSALAQKNDEDQMQEVFFRD